MWVFLILKFPTNSSLGGYPTAFYIPLIGSLLVLIIIS
jgi:hypothetical protein